MKLPPYRGLVLLLSLPIVLRSYFEGDTGERYGVGLWMKCVLAAKFVRNNIRITSGSNFVEHLVMATAILRIPPEAEGCIVECGSYKGASTASLSLVAALCGRDFEVFDSFEGLPEPRAADRAHRVTHWGELHTYEEGGWEGTLDEVKANVAKYGAIEVCSFNVGYFAATLPEFERRTAFVFADVDLRESLETCLQYLWPLLDDGHSFFTHEAPHVEIASLFFDQDWWRNRVDERPPGLIGAGTGLGLIPRPGGFGSALGYAVKAPEALELTPRPQ
jgi:O-methyltransferase